MKKKLFTMVMLVFLAGTAAFGQELTSLSVSKGTLSPALASGTYAYTVNLYTLNASEELTISAAAGEGYTVDGDTDAKTVEPGQTYNYSIYVNETEEESLVYTFTVNVYERKLVIKPASNTTLDGKFKVTDANWDERDGKINERYELSKVAGCDNLYSCTINLTKYFRSKSWALGNSETYDPDNLTGWSDVYEYYIAYRDEYDNAVSTIRNGTARKFRVAENDTEVTFYAAIAADGKIRMICDAQVPTITNSSFAPIGLFKPATGKPYAFSFIFNRATEAAVFDCVAGDFGVTQQQSRVYEDYNFTGNKQKPFLGSYDSGFHVLRLDYDKMTGISTAETFVSYKMLDNLTTPKIKIGNEELQTLDESIDLSGTPFTPDAPLIIGGGEIKGAVTGDGTVNVSDIVTKLYYEIIPEGEETGTVDFIILSTSTSSISKNGSAIWSNTTEQKDISSDLINGTYTLKLWYAAEAYETSLFEDYIITAGKGSGAKYYTTTFTVDNPPVWTGGTDGDWNNPANWSTGEAPSSDDPDIDITIEESDNAPTIPAGTTLNSITFEPGAGADLAGTLTVTEAIKVNLKIETIDDQKRWYSIGFPFDIAKVYAEKWDADLKAYEEGKSGANFWLKEYTGTGFSYVQEIEADKGYIIQFPSGFTGETITFISEPIENFSAGNITLGTTYQLVANPTLNSLTLNAGDGNKHYYLYDPEGNKYNLLEEGEGTLAPFEAPITISAPSTQSLIRSIGGDGSDGTITGIDRGITIESDDPVIATRYYTLQGVEIQQPVEKTIYIIKKTHASQKVETGKVIYIQK
jgi:hypothetical protein